MSDTYGKPLSEVKDVECSSRCGACPRQLRLPSLELEANVMRNGLLLCNPCENRNTSRLEPAR